MAISVKEGRAQLPPSLQLCHSFFFLFSSLLLSCFYNGATQKLVNLVISLLHEQGKIYQIFQH